MQHYDQLVSQDVPKCGCNAMHAACCMLRIAPGNGGVEGMGVWAMGAGVIRFIGGLDWRPCACCSTRSCRRLTHATCTMQDLWMCCRFRWASICMQLAVHAGQHVRGQAPERDRVTPPGEVLKCVPNACCLLGGADCRATMHWVRYKSEVGGQASRRTCI